MSDFLFQQASRLELGGFPKSVVLGAAQTLLNTMKTQQRPEERTELRKGPTVFPYLHKTSHYLKKVGARYGAKLVFNAPIKLGSLGPRSSRRDYLNSCKAKYTKAFVSYSNGAVFLWHARDATWAKPVAAPTTS